MSQAQIELALFDKLEQSRHHYLQFIIKIRQTKTNLIHQLATYSC